MKDHLESSIFGDHDDHADVHDPVGRDAAHPAAPPASRRELREAELAAKRSRGRRRSGGAAREGRGKPPWWRRLIVIVLALAVIGGGVVVAYHALRPVVEGFLESNDYPGPGDGSVRVTVEQGAGGSAIARELVDADVIKSTKAFVEAANADAKSGGIQPGVYEMKKQMRAADALALLVNPKNRIVTRVTIPEGLWATEIYAKLSKASGIPVAQYVAAAKDAGALGLPSSARGNVEGYLFPASYEFAPDSSAAAQLKQMVGEAVKRLDALGIPPEKMERVVILASLVEGEASTEADRGKVARVIENRLASNTSIGFDSTVNYIFKKRGVPTQDMLDSDSPYNTRRFKGLPPGPIANPGESAIQAAAAPPAGDWFYFVTVNLCTGETKFAVTAADHAKNVAAFNAWRESTGGKC
ncbi:MAG TPA: endolytic transglycosylase MltG [Humibacillus xanthopallidus]|nr:endolytic transglycosylase MltG [Humibacillus xanthopallidus]